VTVAVVSDLDVVTAGLRSVLQPFEHEVRVIERVPGVEVDVVLIDPSGRGDDDLRELERLARDASVRHLAFYAQTVSMRAMREGYRYGVRSFLSQALPAADLATAIRHVADGLTVRSPGAQHTATWLGRDDGLTERESQVLVLCADGSSNREIAEALFINVETVKSHLKHAYQRLGLKNRAQATAYVHRTAAAGRMVAVDDSTVAPAGSGGAGRSVAASVARQFEEIAVDEEGLTERRRLLGIDHDERALLGSLVDTVGAGAGDFVERLVQIWASHPETAALVSDPHVRARLVEHQRHYLVELFGGRLDTEHARAMLRTGATHHRIRLSPQWYLTSYVHVVCDHLDVVLDGFDDPGEAMRAVSVLLASVLFDAGLVLDAYEMSVVEHLVRDSTASHTAPTAHVIDQQVESTPAVAMRARTISKVALADEDDTSARARYVGLTDEVRATLHGLAPAIAAAMPSVMDDFYELIEEHSSVSAHLTGGVAVRLRQEVAAFWLATMTGSFDRVHAARCLRVGVVHERIGLSPQHYIAGLARHLAGVLHALPRPGADLRREVDAIIRAAFFDMSFVIDAYLDARAQSLLQTGRFAKQVVTGLANAVAIVDGRDRVEYANEELLDLAGISAAVLRRMPVESALPLEGITALVDSARASAQGRATALHRFRGRDLRVSALRVQRSDGEFGQVALVLDDITDVLRANADLEREDQRFDHVLAAVDALAWEIDLDTHAVVAVSRAAESFTGRRAVDLLGSPALLSLVHPDDRARMEALCRDLEPGQHERIDHRFIRDDGTERWVRSSVVGTTGPGGTRTVSGVSVDFTDVHDELTRLREHVSRTRSTTRPA
jgi:PAS domain S-box-containing protein